MFGINVVLLLLVLAKTSSAIKTPSRPHIIFIMADDLGWNDVGFHGASDVRTPNLDALAYSGLILNKYYVNPMCTPSRSALLTGFHPIHTGLQHYVIMAGAPNALPLTFKTMPQYLNDLNYTSHMVGKWHLGSHRAAYTPSKRGFSSHFGFWNGHADYYDHTDKEFYWGYDLRRNMNVSWSEFGEYSTRCFTSSAVQIIAEHDSSQPLFLYVAHQAVHAGNGYAALQAPAETVAKFEYIKDERRRIFAAMTHELDLSVGKMVQKLAEKDMLQHAIVVFSTDNGGPANGYDNNRASNWPLRGTKDTLWEGGVRGVGLVWSPLIKKTRRLADQMINVQDWLPTLYHAAGGDVSSLPENMDGEDLWDSLSLDQPSPRNLMLHNIDDVRLISSVRVGDWKLIRGETHNGHFNGWYGPKGRQYNYSFAEVTKSRVSRALSQIGINLPNVETMAKLRKQATLDCDRKKAYKRCDLSQQVCLFNVAEDPCEKNNLVFKLPDVVKMLDETIENFRATAVPPIAKPVDPRSDPRFFNYTWTNWLDYYEDLNTDTWE